MPSLLEALTEGVDLTGSPKYSGEFVTKLQEYKNHAVQNFLKYGIDLSKSIAELAGKNNLNDDQVQRIIEEANTQVYLVKYNEMKAQPERDVVFDLASMDKVKQHLGQKDAPIPAPSEAADEDEGAEEKVASWEGEAKGDQLNFMNFSSYDTAGVVSDREKPYSHIELEKIARDLQTIESDIAKAIQKTASAMYTMAGVFIDYDRRGVDVPEVFHQMQKKASLNQHSKSMLKQAIDERIATMVESRKVASDYVFPDFQKRADEEKKKEEFSLEDKSFKEKTEFDNPTNKEVPVVVTDDRVVRNISDLVELANEASRHKHEAVKKMSEKEKLVEASGISEELVEKIASLSDLSAVKHFLK